MENLFKEDLMDRVVKRQLLNKQMEVIKMSITPVDVADGLIDRYLELSREIENLEYGLDYTDKEIKKMENEGNYSSRHNDFTMYRTSLIIELAKMYDEKQRIVEQWKVINGGEK